MRRIIRYTSTRYPSKRSHKAERNWGGHHSTVRIIRPSHVIIPATHPPSIPPFSVYSQQVYPEGWTIPFKQAIRRRDGECMLCEARDRVLDVHHINYQKIDLDPWNLITLCRDCHKLTNSNRQYWYPHLYELMRLKYKRHASLPAHEIASMIRR